MNRRLLFDPKTNFAVGEFGEIRMVTHGTAIHRQRVKSPNASSSATALGENERELRVKHGRPERFDGAHGSAIRFC
jgi:hypothetical protein